MAPFEREPTIYIQERASELIVTEKKLQVQTECKSEASVSDCLPWSSSSS